MLKALRKRLRRRWLFYRHRSRWLLEVTAEGLQRMQDEMTPENDRKEG